MAAAGVKCGRDFNLALLVLTVVAPILLFHDKLAPFSDSLGMEDASGLDHSQDSKSLLAIQEGGEDVKEPVRIIYKDVESSKVDSWNFNGNLFQYKEKDVKLDDGLPKKNSSIFGDKGKDDESRNQTDNQTFVLLEEKFNL